MMQLESNLAPAGTTTVPKALRKALGAEHGGRLIWELLPDRMMRVCLKYAAPDTSKALKTRLSEASGKGAANDGRDGEKMR